MSSETTVMSLRIGKDIKNKLNEIADEKKLSLSELASITLTEYVEQYRKMDVNSFKVPNVDEAKTLREESRKRLMDEGWSITKEYIKKMIDNDLSFVCIPENEMPHSAYELVQARLNLLGYYVYVISQNFTIPFGLHTPNDHYRPGDILIAFSPDDVVDLTKADARAEQGILHY